MMKASTRLLEQETQTPSPAPDLIPAESSTENLHWDWYSKRGHFSTTTASATPPLSGFSPTQAILDGAQKYTKIPVPVLAIYAFPRRLGPEIGNDPAARDAAQARVLALVGAQIKAFQNV